MKRWMLALTLCGALTGCTEGIATDDVAESSATQSLSGDPCTAQMPPLYNFKGQQVPLPSSTQTYVVIPSPYAANEYLGVLVDYGTTKLVTAYRFPNTSLSYFLYLAGAKGRILVPTIPPPPPPITPQYIMALTQQINLAHAVAYDQAKSCTL